MAAAAVDSGVHDLHAMSTRRVPLANNPNAANSPHRTLIGKRQRAPLQDGHFDKQGSPAKKKQALDAGRLGLRKPQPIAVEEVERSMLHQRTETKANVVQKQLVAAREGKQSTLRQERTERPFSGADIEQIKQWRRHYRRIFPTLVFYLDGLSLDARVKYSRQIAQLGAHEEKFFSNAVTHIVTTRQVPTSSTDPNPADATRSLGLRGQPSTIDPTLLEKFSGLEEHPKGRENLALASFPRRNVLQVHSNESRTAGTQKDVLQKALDLGIKIWAHEKFERMMTAMFNEEFDDDEKAHSKAASHQMTRANKDTDLSQLLKKEKYNATVDRNPWHEIIPFKSFYVYIHDMDERTKPVMVREYNKARRKEDGEWPQFRSCAPGRCPFVDDNSRTKSADKTVQTTRDEQREAVRGLATQQRLTRASAAIREKPLTRRAASVDLGVADDGSKHEGTKAIPETSQVPKVDVFEPPRLKVNSSAAADSMPPLFTTAQANYRGLAGVPGGEPVASGMHHHPRTSAIQSNAPSSTAHMPGRRAGTTKEMHQLQRRVLDKHSGLSGSAGSSYLNEVRAAINNDQTGQGKRSGRRPGAATLTLIHEDEVTIDESKEAVTVAAETRRPVKRRKKTMVKELKPGFCENCREKYDDFETHVMDKKHREFAMADENWVELDDLLRHLQRPSK